MVSQKFKEEYARLNAKQKEAVDTIEGPVMVIAGPGTGKTTILTLRIANILLKTDTPPSGILALTFTEAGAKNMRAKLREVIGETALQVPIHTFHGFAASVIAEFSDHFPHLARCKQLTEVESETLLRDILQDKKFWKLRPLGDPDFYISKIIAAVSDAKQEAWMPEMLRSFAKEEIERIKSDPAALSTRGKTKGELKGESLRRIEKCERTLLLAEVYEKLEERKREERKIDFDDLIFELLKGLEKDELLLRTLQERYLYILVDEHQDTNDSQNMIVRRLADFFENPNLFVVGDEKQAIYRFQGASVENFLSFQKTWGAMKLIALRDNYRSHQHILDASFKMIENNYKEDELAPLRLKLIAGGKGKPAPLELIAAPDRESEEAWLVGKIKEITAKDKEGSIAIILRKNSDVAKIFSLLEENGVPASAERGANIFSHPAGSLFFSLLEFLADPSNFECLAETLALGLWRLPFEKQVSLVRLARSGNLKEIKEEIPAIEKLQKMLLESSTLEYLYLAADLSGFADLAARNPVSIEVWRGILALSQELAAGSGIENPRELIKKLLDYKKSAERRVIKINTGSLSAQTVIMTAHSSKGLEFDYVFLPFADEETWLRRSYGSFFVLPKEKESDDDLRDERRLFYVALTRAKKHVALSFSATPLRFIDELNQDLVSRFEIPKAERPKAERSFDKLKERRHREKIEYAKRVVSESGLSVTALNHFLECPRKFFYQSILKLPEAPTASSEKGTTMHEAMAAIWRSAERKSGAKEITKIIVSTVQNYFKSSLLPLFQKEEAQEELMESAPKVAECLADHFKEEGSLLAESWFEAPFVAKLKNEPIEVRLHGRLDAVLEEERKVSIFDYKTREALSVNAIKGETKDSDGNYFRQLVFYKILLAENSRYRGKSIEPALVFIKPDRAGRCPIIALPIEPADIEKVKSEISSLIESVWSGSFLESSCGDPLCKYCAYEKLSD